MFKGNTFGERETITGRDIETGEDFTLADMSQHVPLCCARARHDGPVFHILRSHFGNQIVCIDSRHVYCCYRSSKCQPQPFKETLGL